MRQALVLTAVALATVFLATLPACGGMASARAEQIASMQHNCPRDQVRTIGPGGHWQYWLDVCGRRRLYDTQGGDYRDITSSVE